MGNAGTYLTTDQTPIQKITINVPSGQTYAYDGVIGIDASATPIEGTNIGSIEVTKTGPGTQVFGGANTFTGGLQINEGTLRIGVTPSSSTAVGTGPVTLGTNSTNATLDLNGQTEMINGLSTGSGAAANSQIIGNSSTSSDATLVINGTSNFGGIIKDALGAGTRKTAVTFSGGTLTLSNANTYSGPTNVTSGKLLLAPGGALPNSQAIIVSTAATFALNPGAVSLTTSGLLSLENGSTFDMIDGAISNYSLTGTGIGLKVGSATVRQQDSTST